MDNPTALEKARAASHSELNYVSDYQLRKIAAALKRAFADGLNVDFQHDRKAEVNRIRAEADQLEGK